MSWRSQPQVLDLSAIGENLAPDADSTRTNGTGTKAWSNTFTDVVTLGQTGSPTITASGANAQFSGGIKVGGASGGTITYGSYWQMVGSLVTSGLISGPGVYPPTDNAYDIGLPGSSLGWRGVYGHKHYIGNTASAPYLSSGSGSPEGVVTAPVGSLYVDTGGGASTTLYVKESGTGNTGWVAK